jgi:hypothetical protein
MARSTSEIDSHPGNKQALSGNDADSIPPVHRDAVTTLAGDMRISVDRVHKLYCIVLERLSKEARIRDYLPILVTKKVRNLMRKHLEIKDRLATTQSRIQSERLTLDEQR